MPFRDNMLDTMKRGKTRAIVEFTTPKMVPKVRVAYQEWLMQPAGSSFTDLAAHLHKLWPDQFPPPDRAAIAILAKWHRKYEWEKAILETSLAKKTERLRILMKMGEQLSNSIDERLTQGGKAPVNDIACLRGLFTDIEWLTRDDALKASADNRPMNVINVETMISTIQEHRRANGPIQLQEGSYEVTDGSQD